MLATVLFLVIGSVAGRAAGPTGPADEDASGPPALLALINRDRAAAGLGPMVLRDDVAAIALAHSHRMADAGTIWHNDDYFTPASRSRLDAAALAENVALNASLTDAHDRLMNSPGHRANILDPRLSVVGIGVVRDAAATNYITQNFLAPRSAENTVVVPAGSPAPSPAPAAPPAPAKAPGPAPAPARAAATRPRSVPAAATPAPPASIPPTTVSPSELPASTPEEPVKLLPEPRPGSTLMAAPAGRAPTPNGLPFGQVSAVAAGALAMALAQCTRAVRRRHRT